jgi:hypothetical protein
LSLWFYGDPNNVAGQLYVKVNGVKVPYDGESANLAQPMWRTWNVDLAAVGTNLQSVTGLAIGIEGTGAKGTLLLDDIRLYHYARQLITPVQPDPNGLAGHWTFDEGSGTTAGDSSGRQNHGTITGAQWVVGQVGGALKFNGAEYVEIPPAAWSTVGKQVTIAFWAYGDAAAQPQAGFIFAAYQDPAVNNSRVVSSHCPWSDGTVYFDTGGTASGYDRISKAAIPAIYEGSWQHWAFTKNADTGEQSIYLDGALWHSATGMTRTMAGVTVFTIGCKPGRVNYYMGMMDDFRLYDRALLPAEIAGLAGVTKPFDKAF